MVKFVYWSDSGNARPKLEVNSVFYVYYIIYLLAWLFGATRQGDAVVKTKRLGIRIAIVSLLSGIAFFALISGVQMGGLIFAAIPLFVLFPAFALGIGIAVSTIAKVSVNKELSIAAYLLGAISLAGPTLAILLFWWDQHTNNQQRRDVLAAFQKITLVGKFGDHIVQFPASPQLETIHACEGYQRCHTKFQRSGDTLQFPTNKSSEDVRFLEIELIPVHSTCDGPSAPLNACLLQSELQEWCETRSALFESAWCRGRPMHRIVFSPVEEDDLHRSEEQGWADIGLDSFGTDYNSDPIEIECSLRRDESILSNPHLSRYCRIRFRVTSSVSTTVFLDRFEPFELEAHAKNMLGYANEIWTSMGQQ